jgi:hypothetical protein
MSIKYPDPDAKMRPPGKRAVERVEFRPASRLDSMYGNDHVLIIGSGAGNCTHVLSKADLAGLIGSAAAYLAGLA